MAFPWKRLTYKVFNSDHAIRHVKNPRCVACVVEIYRQLSVFVGVCQCLSVLTRSNTQLAVTHSIASTPVNIQKPTILPFFIRKVGQKPTILSFLLKKVGLHDLYLIVT